VAVGPQWTVAIALGSDGTFIIELAGRFIYPLKCGLGPVGNEERCRALSLLRLAHLYGPDVLALRSDSTDGLHPKFDSVSFIDAASMATGFGARYVVHAAE